MKIAMHDFGNGRVFPTLIDSDGNPVDGQCAVTIKPLIANNVRTRDSEVTVRMWLKDDQISDEILEKLKGVTLLECDLKDME